MSNPTLLLGARSFAEWLGHCATVLVYPFVAVLIGGCNLTCSPHRENDHMQPHPLTPRIPVLESAPPIELEELPVRRGHVVVLQLCIDLTDVGVESFTPPQTIDVSGWFFVTESKVPGMGHGATLKNAVLLSVGHGLATYHVCQFTPASTGPAGVTIRDLVLLNMPKSLTATFQLVEDPVKSLASRACEMSSLLAPD